MSQILNTSTDTAWKDADTLISILRTWGIEYLIGLEQASSPSPIEQVSSTELIKRLAQQNENSRIRDASISLFLLHPELTDAILEVICILQLKYNVVINRREEQPRWNIDNSVVLA